MDANGNSTNSSALATEELKFGILKICLFSTFFILGLVGNSLVLIGIGLNKGMQTSTNLLIFNLALADVLFIIVCIPTTLFSFFGRWPFADFGCKLGKFSKNEWTVERNFLSSTIYQSFICFYEYLSSCIHVRGSIFCCCTCH